MRQSTKLITASVAGVALIFCLAFNEVGKTHETYCEIMGTKQFLSNKLTITADYGEPTKWLTDTRIKDETGKVEKFNSMVDAMNYMAEHGWEFVCAFPVTVGNNQVYHYTFKKTVTEDAAED